ncbi:hypothetical protein E2C01_046908 [Portunus trituberculatus]|uniref:RNA-directed DNA polymerase from mobile element jockey n=1 Tax=Portunus trituberculatus TaxID=210409 RepID=A0A5B7G917_PORTR|nr:hypothetical protein [Portunus trituberculatus]
MENFVPKYTKKTLRTNQWFNKNCKKTKRYNGSILPEEKQMQDMIVLQSDIEKVISVMDVNKSMGPDGVSGKMLKECQEQLLEPILDIVKTSTTTGQVPVEWKRADLVPIYIQEWMSNGAIEL